MGTVNEVMCIVSSEDHLQNNVKESMDQIRKTMMQHEALFKEQVHALHKLYHIQKLAMQETRKRIYSQAQALAFNSGSVVVGGDRFRGSIMEGEPLRPAYSTAAQVYKEPVALSLHPFSAFKEFKGCSSFRIDGRGIKTFCTSQSKPVKNFDLEKLPEDYIDESGIEVEPNSSETDASLIFSKTSPNRDQDGCVGANLAVIGVDSPKPEPMNQETDLRIILVPSKEITQDCGREGKFLRIDINKCATSFWNPNNSTDNNISPDFLQYLPAVGQSPTYADSSPSTNRHIDKPTLLHQGSLVSSNRRLNPIKFKEFDIERIPEQAEGDIDPVSAGLHQYLESDTTCSHLKLDGENAYIGRDSFDKNSVICSQGSSTLESLQCEPKNLNRFFVQKSLSCETDSVSGKQYPLSFVLASQTSIDGGNENQNDSGDGSNSIQSLDSMSCKEVNISINRKDTAGLGDDYCEPGQMSHGRVEAVQFELEEVPQFIKCGMKPPLSSTLLDSEIKGMDHSDCSNGEPRTVPGLEELTESNEDPKDKSAVDEAHENIAADILLTFTPSRSHEDSQSHGARIKAESGKYSGDNTSSNKKWNLRERRYTNYSYAGGINESIKWTKSVRKRRTSRRPQ
ncbi:hypothetical protein L1049_013426 [Liquidambar formosana]|uniref:Uncharacterized protein n=1 Tax=Liquidambar formosana TaxID=63359 RepID=A0AAP0WU29_LIQFO